MAPRPALSKQLANFTNSTAGLDLTLRLIHALVIIAAQVSHDEELVKASSIADLQIGLGRRYLRLFCFLDCFHNVYELLTGRSKTVGSLSTTLDLIESSCLGMYIFLENFTMLHDMNIRLVSWYTPLLVEANKFWFYAICASIARTVFQLLTLDSASSAATAKKRGHARKKSSKSDKNLVVVATDAPDTTKSRVSLLVKLVVDCCDLTLPASFIGWVTLGNLEVGSAMLVSTILVWPSFWTKYQ